MSSWSLVRFAHVLAATAWVGGQIVLAAIVVPAVRASLEAPAQRTVVLRAAGERFATVANAVLLPTLAASGVALVWHRRVGAADLVATTYGRLLSAKLVLVAASVAFAAAHGIVARRHRGSSRALAVAGLVASISIVAFATALVG